MSMNGSTGRPAREAPGPARRSESPGRRQDAARGGGSRARGHDGDEHGDIARAVARFQSGRDRNESFDLLFGLFHRRIERFFARRVASAEDRRDLTQETFLRAYRGLDGFRGEAPFGAWLYRIAWNVAAERGRRRPAGDRPAEVSYGIVPPRTAPSVGPERGGLDSVMEQEERRILRRAIEALPEQRRKCIALWAYQGLTYAQIATVLGLAVGTVKAHMAQAKAQLEELVERRSVPHEHP